MANPVRPRGRLRLSLHSVSVRRERPLVAFGLSDLQLSRRVPMRRPIGFGTPTLDYMSAHKRPVRIRTAYTWVHKCPSCVLWNTFDRGARWHSMEHGWSAPDPRRNNSSPTIARRIAGESRGEGTTTEPERTSYSLCVTACYAERHTCLLASSNSGLRCRRGSCSTRQHDTLPIFFGGDVFCLFGVCLARGSCRGVL